ncbi:hypothetical protein ABTX71_34850 [Streptomyces parvulus]|uniref:hypothetical protein n=1 Tax=Streptomyces parvulus TaxID=146923 RepID=UPI003325AAE7
MAGIRVPPDEGRPLLSGLSRETRTTLLTERKKSHEALDAKVRRRGRCDRRRCHDPGGRRSVGVRRSAYRCNYPEVCFYADPNVQSAIVARFQVVTSSWQYLQYPNTGYAVVNTRNDDVAYVLQSDGKVLCVKPNGSFGSGERVVAVRIDSRSSC